MEAAVKYWIFEYENQDGIFAILSLIIPATYDLFYCNRVVTKAAPFAKERISALKQMGLRKTENKLIGHEGSLKMKIVVINGTEIKGCTYQIKESFLEALKEENEILEFFLPKDLPHFCCGCKTCFFKSENHCPHAEYVMPIWNAILEAELIVFASPVYALRTTAQMKALLDHICVHWMVHRPDERMFYKKAVILTSAIGIFNAGAQKDIATSLSWLGVSDIKMLGVGLLEGIIWNELSEKRRRIITNKVKKLSKRYTRAYTANRGIKVMLKFTICKMMHKAVAKNENPLSADNQYWVDKGWITK